MRRAALAFGSMVFALGALAGAIAVAAGHRRTSPRSAHDEERGSSAWAGPHVPPARAGWCWLVSLALGALVLAGGVAGGWWWEQSQEAIDRATRLTGGDPGRGRLLVRHYGCAGCHMIPGIAGADGRAAPSLAGVAGRVWIAGSLQNTPDVLVGWIEDPRALQPGTAMPSSGARGQEARDIAAFLYTLR